MQHVAFQAALQKRGQPFVVFRVRVAGDQRFDGNSSGLWIVPPPLEVVWPKLRIQMQGHLECRYEWCYSLKIGMQLVSDLITLSKVMGYRLMLSRAACSRRDAVSCMATKRRSLIA